MSSDIGNIFKRLRVIESRLDELETNYARLDNDYRTLGVSSSGRGGFDPGKPEGGIDKSLPGRPVGKRGRRPKSSSLEGCDGRSGVDEAQSGEGVSIG